MLIKKNVSLITPLCPDYEHVKIGEGLYKYTFNKLGDGLGLIGKRLISILNNLHKILEENDIKFKHILLYGDFEAYSNKICERLKITEKEFRSKLSKSIKCMRDRSNKNCTVDLVVNYLSNRKSWKKRCIKNEKSINNMTKSNSKFNKFIEEIERSSATRLLLMALKNSLRYKNMIGFSYLDLIKSGFSLLKQDPLKPAQALMAVNSPVIIQKAMVEGLPDEGAMPTGLIAGEINNLLSCKDLINSLIEDALNSINNDF